MRHSFDNPADTGVATANWNGRHTVPQADKPEPLSACIAATESAVFEQLADQREAIAAEIATRLARKLVATISRSLSRNIADAYAC